METRTLKSYVAGNTAITLSGEPSQVVSLEKFVAREVGDHSQMTSVELTVEDSSLVPSWRPATKIALGGTHSFLLTYTAAREFLARELTLCCGDFGRMKPAGDGGFIYKCIKCTRVVADGHTSNHWLESNLVNWRPLTVGGFSDRANLEGWSRLLKQRLEHAGWDPLLSLLAASEVALLAGAIYYRDGIENV